MRGPVSCLFIAVLAGCPGDASDGASDPDDLVGTWREVPMSNVTAQPDRFTIKADHTYVLTHTTAADVGTYDADDLTITIRSDIGTVHHATSLNYVIDSDQLLLGALLPVGDTDGVIGSWHGDESQDLEVVKIALDVRADGTVHYTFDSSVAGHDAADGAWRIEAGDFVTRLAVGTTLRDVHWKSISNRAIGNGLFVRVP